MDVSTDDEPRNRVSLNIEIDEGEVAEIKTINIVGNNSYSDEEILKGFELKTGGWFSFFTNDNRYSREKLKGDIESLESFYKNRGYVDISYALGKSYEDIKEFKKAFFHLNIANELKFNEKGSNLEAEKKAILSQAQKSAFLDRPGAAEALKNRKPRS